MKKRLPAFATGMLTMALIVGLGMSALAATGSFTISVDPISIQVDGQTFAPKDANGADVPVFAYNGTTYAPLRALAEAYGLTVGYDGTANMATVASADLPSQPPVTTTPTSFKLPASLGNYEDFKALWTLRPHDGSSAYSALMVAGIDDNEENRAKFKTLWNGAPKEQRSNLMKRFLDDVRTEHPDCEYIGFVFNGGSLGASGTLGYVEVKDIQ